MELGHLNIPKPEPESLVFVPDVSTRLFSIYLRLATETEVGRQVMATLQDDPRVQGLEGKMLCSGNTIGLFSINSLVMWFLWCANEVGEDAAKQHLEDFLNADEIPVVAALWVLGIETDEIIELAGGYRIVPIDDMPDSREKEMYKRVDYRFHPHMPRTPRAAICRTCKVPKTCSADSGPEEQKEFWDSSRHLGEIALLVNAVGTVACVPYLSTSYLLPTTPTGPFEGSGGGYTRYDALGSGCSKLTSDVASVLDGLRAAYAAVPQEQARYNRILSRLSQARRREQIEDRVLDLGIALEMALLDENRSADQLSMTFRLRGSWLLGHDSLQRQAIYRDLQDLYKFRSQIAHTGVLCGNKSSELEAVRDRFPALSELAGRIVARLILSGRPDWTQLVLGAI